MQRNSGSRKLSVLMLLFGVVAFLLRMGLYQTAVDVKGLLLRNHPLEIALIGLTAAAAAVLVFCVRKIDDSGRFEDCYRADLAAAVGSVAAGTCILATVLTAAPGAGGYLENAWRILGLAVPVCLFLVGVARVQGKRPFFALHVVVCLFFVVHIVNRYQHWSGNPQLQDYVFSLLGAMALMFFGFYLAALEADCGHPRMTLGMGLAAIYLCMAELGRTSDSWLYLGGLLWVLTDLAGMQISAADQQM